MIKKRILFGLLGFVLMNCKKDEQILYVPLSAETGEELSGGEVTSFDISQNAFGFSASNLEGDDALHFFTGNSLFNQNWVTSPASTTARDGLGPMFNARSCSGCHFKDGRGRAPKFDGELNHGLLLRLSIPGTGTNGGGIGDPVYKGQLQDQSIPDVETEGGFRIEYTNVEVKYPDGTEVTLRKPKYHFTNLKYGAISSSIEVSPRVANQMIGLGLLEAVPESIILSFADENDTNSDGISGKANRVWDVASQATVLGRFGWKANQPSLRQQVAGAFLGDMGITSSLFPDENCPDGLDCSTLPNGGSPEISDENLDKVTLYSSTLAVPARRNHDAREVLEGKELFTKINCTACHIAKMQTGSHKISALENQTIRPYTDMLLHDMGDELADNRPDFLANGNEWRTQPLWGIGLIQTVNGHTQLLHDGRARNIEEAILWHGGEARQSKEDFMNLSKEERVQLLTFVNSL
ncbi:MAG: c-type cytochrome [Flavobacteriales bacterium]|nr:c-type cytochrome [Flavobacteriales bacterium]